MISRAFFKGTLHDIFFPWFCSSTPHRPLIYRLKTFCMSQYLPKYPLRKSSHILLDFPRKEDSGSHSHFEISAVSHGEADFKDSIIGMKIESAEIILRQPNLKGLSNEN
jgi:hypothetical protein